MEQFRRPKWIAAVLCAALLHAALPATLLAQGQAPPPAAAGPPDLDRVRSRRTSI